MQNKDEIKVMCENKLAELQPMFDSVSEIANEFYHNADSLTFSNYEKFERTLVGVYTFINTAYKEFDAKVDALEATYFVQLKVKAEIDGVKFVAEAGNRESKEYAADLRLATAILESWTLNIEQLLSTCRRHFYIEKKEYRNGRD